MTCIYIHRFVCDALNLSDKINKMNKIDTFLLKVTPKMEVFNWIKSSVGSIDYNTRRNSRKYYYMMMQDFWTLLPEGAANLSTAGTD